MFDVPLDDFLIDGGERSFSIASLCLSAGSRKDGEDQDEYGGGSHVRYRNIWKIPIIGKCGA